MKLANGAVVDAHILFSLHGCLEAFAHRHSLSMTVSENSKGPPLYWTLSHTGNPEVWVFFPEKPSKKPGVVVKTPGAKTKDLKIQIPVRRLTSAWKRSFGARLLARLNKPA